MAYHLGEALKRAEAAEAAIKSFNAGREDASVAEMEERERIRALMQRLEVERSELEKKQVSINKQEQLLDEQRRQIQEHTALLKVSEQEFNERLTSLAGKVSNYNDEEIDYPLFR